MLSRLWMQLGSNQDRLCFSSREPLQSHVRFETYNVTISGIRREEEREAREREKRHQHRKQQNLFVQIESENIDGIYI